MDNFKDLTFRRILYWLTDHREKPTRFVRLWGFLVFVCFAFFLVSESAEIKSLLVITMFLAIIWLALTMAYLLWEIRRRVGFLAFKRRTQRKDDPFEVPQISSDKKLKPKGFDRAG
jgi:hypothetical protein